MQMPTSHCMAAVTLRAQFPDSRARRRSCELRAMHRPHEVRHLVYSLPAACDCLAYAVGDGHWLTPSAMHPSLTFARRMGILCGLFRGKFLPSPWQAAHRTASGFGISQVFADVSLIRNHIPQLVTAVILGEHSLTITSQLPLHQRNSTLEILWSSDDIPILPCT
jgi:hypothetical protein